MLLNKRRNLGLTALNSGRKNSILRFISFISKIYWCWFSNNWFSRSRYGYRRFICWFLNAIARSPFFVDELFRYALLGFALTEAMGLLAVMMAFLILYS